MSSAEESKSTRSTIGGATIIQGDCREIVHGLADESVHLVLTDPPYFLDGLDGDWKKGKRAANPKSAISGIPSSMKFDPRQGRDFQKFLAPLCADLLRVLKPGGFVLMFSAPRMVHRAAAALEDAGFGIRDQYVWRYTKRAQFKSFSMDHFIRKRDCSEEERERILKALNGRRTPQLRPQFEPMVCAQKPAEGTLLDAFIEHGTGLIDPKASLDGSVPSTVMTVEKERRDEGNVHLTPKPVELIRHLVELFTMEGQTVLDPFLGSGTTCVAAEAAGRKSIGIEIDAEYAGIARTRVGREAKARAAMDGVFG